MSEKIFKGIKQVTYDTFNAAKEANELSGYLWFVRTPFIGDGESDETNDLSNDSYDIYFGSRKYGHFSEGEIEGIKTQIEGLNGDIADILETLETMTSVLESHTELISSNTQSHQANAESIRVLQENLATYLIKNIDANDKILTVADGILSSKLDLVYEEGFIRLKGKNSTTNVDGEDVVSQIVISEFDASEFVKDSVLEDVEVIEKEDGEKYLSFTWKTEGEQTKTDEIKISDFAKIYSAGTALEVDSGDTFNVKVAANGNFLSVNENNELIVDDVTTDKTMIKESITIEGGPLATDAVKNAFKKVDPETNEVSYEIPANTDIQSVLKALLCVEIYPTPKANTPSYSVSISAPSITATANNKSLSDGSLVEVGQQVTFASVTATTVSISKTEPKVTGFTHGYSDVVSGGTITDKDSVSGAWTVSQMDNQVYQLEATVTGFTGTVPTLVQSSANTTCVLSGCTLEAVSGTNTYKVTEDAPKHTGSHNGVSSYYVVSNLNGRSEEHKSPSISATTNNVEKDPSNQSKTFTVTGVYPIFTNGVTASTTDATAAAMADLSAHVGGDGTKLALMKANTSFAVSFAAHTEGVEGYRLYLPGEWKVNTAMAINANTAKFAVDQKAKFVALADKVKRTIQGKEVDYTVYEYLATEGANRVKFTVG